MFCEKCGKQINDDAAFCPHCGFTMGETSESNAVYSEQMPMTTQFNSRTKIIIALSILGKYVVSFGEYYLFSLLFDH